MKKIVFLIALLVTTLTLATVKAETYPNTLPGGKNYLDPENLEVSGTVMNTIDSIYVKANQVYTLSFPDFDMLGEDVYVIVSGSEYYVDDPIPNSVCGHGDDRYACTFTTASTEDNLYIEIHGEYMSMYYEYYQFDYFQLEEGLVHTEYEEYVSPYIDTTNPSFEGVGAYVTSYNSGLTTEEIVDAHIIAYDEIDGDISNQIEIVSDQYTGNELIVGDYLVELSVSDDAGNTTTFDLYILVKDEIPPTVTAPADIYMSVDYMRVVNDIVQEYVIYEDDYDMNPTLIIVYDEYTGNERVVGSYEVVIEVEDSHQNVTSHSMTVHIEDESPPVLNSSNMLVVNVNTPVLIDEIINSLDITDNYDTTIDIEIVNDYYSGNETTTGIYFVDMNLVDDANNITEVTVTIAVSDTEDPVITGPSTVTLSYREVLTPEQIKELFTVTDNYDVFDTNDILITSDTYSVNYEVPGEYRVELFVSDSNGNEVVHTLEMIVVDDVAPRLYIDQYIVVVDPGSTFGEADMMKLLRLSNEIKMDEYTINVIQDEYHGNEDIAGNYIYKVLLTDAVGNETVREFNITVPQEETEIDYKWPIIYSSIGIGIVVGAVLFKKYK